MKSRYLAVLVAGLGLWPAGVSAQQGGFNPSAMASGALAQPFVGITEDGTPRQGLFERKSTGVPTEVVTGAARDFITVLNDGQRQKILFPVDDSEWRNWANIHRFQRQGVSLQEMSPEQRDKAYNLLRASLSAKGYQTSRDIMRLNHHLAELVSNFQEYGEHLYWFTIMGEPSASAPWGWQIDGHHLIINYFVLGDQIVMTPTFMGSEPVMATSGQYEGTAILQAEQAFGLRFMQSLPSEQQTMASTGQKQGRSDNLTEMFKDNAIVPFEGLRADRMSEEHRRSLMDLISLYVANIRDGHAEIKIEEVRAHLDATYFAWRGGTDDDAIFYYRIHSPVILIEFDHQGPIALSGERDMPTRNHIHTVVRTPNGNDYGKDLLRQHYEAHKHDPAHGHTHE